MISSMFVLRIKVETERFPLQHQVLVEGLAGRVIAQPGVNKLSNQLGIMKAITQSRSISVDRNLADLEFLVSQ